MAVLYGRGTECVRLDQLLAEAHRGRSAALVVRGEAGTGKSTLLDYVAERADGGRVLRAIGVEWEMELPFAGLSCPSPGCVSFAPGCSTVSDGCRHRNERHSELRSV